MANNYFNINGLVDTSNTVFDNINSLANSSGCFFTWDPALGKWSVIINQSGTSVKSFDDTNILGEIALSGTGITDLFNSVSVSFPNKDTRDTVDVVELEIASADRFPQELDNSLELALTGVNDPIQAQYIASRELKQSRLDKIIEFRTNYEANDVRAGDLVDVTNTALDYSSKLFRVIQIDEEDTDDGNLIFSIIAQEYDADIYSTAGLSYEYRSNFTGIKSKVFNAEIDAKDDYADGVNLGRLLAANLGAGLLRSLFTSDDATETVQQELEFADRATQELMTAGAKTPDLTHETTTTNLCSGAPATINLSHDCSVCFLTTPNYTYDYTITGCTANEVNVDLTGTVTLSGSSGSFTFTPSVSTQKSITVTIGGESTVFDVIPVQTKTYNVTSTDTTITEGDTFTLTLTTTGVSDGTSVDYTISGSASSKVSVPGSLTGSVTVNSNTATLEIRTTDDSAYNADQELDIVFDSSYVDYCAIGSNSITIIVENDDATGPITPDIPKPGDFSCDYVQVPIIWCGTFDADTQYLKSVTVKKYAFLPQVSSGGTAVPTSLTVNNAGTASASITIGDTVNIDATAGIGGSQIDVITSFSTLPSGGNTHISGTTTTFNGYWDNVGE